MCRMVDRMVSCHCTMVLEWFLSQLKIIIWIICGSFKGQLVAIYLREYYITWGSFECAYRRLRTMFNLKDSSILCCYLWRTQLYYTRSRHSLRWMQSWLTNAKLLGNAGPATSITSLTTMLLMAFFKVLQVRRTSQPRQDASFLLAGQFAHRSSTLHNLNPKWEWSVDDTAGIVQMAIFDADVCAA